MSAYYDGGSFALMGSVVNDLANDVEDDTSTLGTELGVALMPMEGLTAKLFYLTESDNDLINFWTSYEISSFTFAFEYNVADYASGAEADGFLLMGYYSMGDFGFTVRFHDWSVDDAAGDTTFENSAITLAPSYAIGDNLLIVAEYRMDDNGDFGPDVDTFALEALFTF